MYLIDTNVLSELPKRRPDRSVLTWFSEQKTIVFSAITLEELAFGVARAKPDQARKLKPWFERLLDIPPVMIPVDEKIAHTAGLLRAGQEKAGKTTSQADMLIAATAITTGRVLVTRNIKDFQGCGVSLLNPFSTL